MAVSPASEDAHVDVYAEPSRQTQPPHPARSKDSMARDVTKGWSGCHISPVSPASDDAHEEVQRITLAEYSRLAPPHPTIPPHPARGKDTMARDITKGWGDCHISPVSPASDDAPIDVKRITEAKHHQAPAISKISSGSIPNGNTTSNYHPSFFGPAIKSKPGGDKNTPLPKLE